MGSNWLDKVIAWASPQTALKRTRARAAEAVVKRHYEGAASGRRTQGWKRTGVDANAAMSGATLARLRGAARDLVRNNGHAESALTTIVDHVVGWGIVAKPKPASASAMKAWQAWAGSTACDSDGRHDFAGLQKLAIRTVAESGECLVRRRFRFPEDGLPIPLQIQVLEPDYLDSDKNEHIRNDAGRIIRRIIHGVEYDMLGKRVAYWMFSEHPGSHLLATMASRRVPAENILHIYRQDRPGQVRGVSWFAPVLLKFKDFDEFSDATLMKQKIAACLAVITSDVDGSASPLGTTNPDDSTQDMLEPGLILNVTPGRNVEVVNPPSVQDYPAYSTATLHEIASGLGVSYEDLTGDFSRVNFSSARMSRLRHWLRVEDWRWRLLIPQFCSPVWAWAMEAAVIGTGGVPGIGTAPGASWTAPPAPMIEPDKEGLAHQRNVRTGITTMPEVLRERGYDPDEVLAEMAEWNKKLDKQGIVLDSDPRKTTQAGQPVAAMLPQETEPDPEPEEEPEQKEESGRILAMAAAQESAFKAGAQVVIEARRRKPLNWGSNAPTKE
jgi:lambda family phage portal protein